MTTVELEQEIRRISERLKAIAKETPEMTGMDWANDHGWISQEEWDAAEEKCQAGLKLQEEEVQKIEALRRAHPKEMDEFLGAHIGRLKKVRDGLAALSQAEKAKGLEFAMSFNLVLLPDVISCLKVWRANAKPEHSIGWAWRVSFNLVDECDRFIGQHPQNDAREDNDGC